MTAPNNTDTKKTNQHTNKTINNKPVLTLWTSTIASSQKWRHDAREPRNTHQSFVPQNNVQKDSPSPMKQRCPRKNLILVIRFLSVTWSTLQLTSRKVSVREVGTEEHCLARDKMDDVEEVDHKTTNVARELFTDPQQQIGKVSLV